MGAGRWGRLDRWDRGTVVTGSALLALVGLAWAAVVQQALHLPMPMRAAGMVTAADLVAFVAAWGVMMAAMMLPSATPMIVLYRTVGQSLSRSGQQAIPTSLFAATYLAVWLLTGIPVYLASVGVAALADSGAGRWLPYALAAVLVAAGAYQFSTAKRVCLRYCQTPLSFLMARWRTGYAATLRLGLSHAAYCVGCCWGLMVVLVAAGAMSLPWVLLIAAVVFVEKLLPRAAWAPAAVGLALAALGMAVAISPQLAITLRGGGLEPLDARRMVM